MENSNIVEKFKIFKAYVENENELKIKCLRSVGGGEIILEEFEYFYEKHGIRSLYLV